MTATSGAIVLVTPHGRALVEQRGWTTRPARLAEALSRAGHPVVVIARTSPRRSWAARGRIRWDRRFGLAWETSGLSASTPRMFEHPFPAGPLEWAAVRHIIRSLELPVAAVVVSDPRSAGILAGRLPGRRVFDAYDAWDLSPLFRDRGPIVRAIERGYRLAAEHADLVTANTPFMLQRMSSLGARRAELLPNGAPEAMRPPADGRNVLYLGNVQRRVRLDLLRASADAARAFGVVLRLAGTVQDEPPGWSQLLAEPAVEYVGPVYGAALEAELRATRVGIVPHSVDRYTLSQDSMKAWEYLAAGAAVVSAPVPPAISVPGLARIADDPETFRAAVTAALASPGVGEREARHRLAVEHSWAARAAALVSLVAR